MDRYVLAKMMAFRNEDDYASAPNGVMEIVNIDGDEIEIGFDVSKVRVYLTFSLSGLVKMAMTREATP